MSKENAQSCINLAGAGAYSTRMHCYLTFPRCCPSLFRQNIECVLHTARILLRAFFVSLFQIVAMEQCSTGSLNTVFKETEVVLKTISKDEMQHVFHASGVHII